MITKIYLDMDGVICNFEKRYEELFGMKPAEADRDRKEWTKNWEQFCTTHEFATLDWWPGGIILLDHLKRTNVPVEILSSSGGKKFHEQVQADKISWLKDHNILYKPNIVPGRSYKTAYARPDTVLIDDTPDIIDAFNKAGGHGILHKDVYITIETLDQLLKTAK